ncbi:MAG: thrombospondin type 3 repeat-containing protein [Nannocystaceae bacterium]
MSISKSTTIANPASARRRGLQGVLALGTLGVVAFADTGCIRDTDCGICDPDKLVLESISGVNYASKKVHVLGPTCKGDNCPGAVKSGSYFVEDIGPCEDSEDAKASPRGPEEYCKISPLVVAFGIEFVFNNLLEPTSVELVRKRPDQPKLFEVYDWKTSILDIVGPTSRYNGDFVKGTGDEPDRVTRLVNLSCIDNLADEGTPFDHTNYEDPRTNPCNGTHQVDGELLPYKMRIGTPDAKLQSYRGLWTAGSNSCDTPQEGYDSCCSECDFLLSTRVAKYGLNANGDPRKPIVGANPLGADPNGAITCDAMAGDPLVECKDFIVGVDRSDEDFKYTYYWSCEPGSPGCEPETFSVPWSDKVRETHPDQRPAHLENLTSKCSTTQECRDVHDLDGTVCMGEKDGAACVMGVDPDCAEGVCRSQWFVTCVANPDTTGGTIGYCVDRRFSDTGAGACLFTESSFEGQCNDEGESCKGFDGRTQIAACDSEANDAVLSATECCQDSLGAVDTDPDTEGTQCDPLALDSLRPVPRYGRSDKLPENTRNCICEDNPDDVCVDVVNAACRDENGKIRPDRAGEYAVMFIERRGGVVYDPAIKGVEWRPADLGGIPRADIESCAEGRGLVGLRNRHEGWRENDAFLGESFEDFDRAMCSGSEYTVTFATPGDREYLVDKVGNTLEGKNEYTFTTAEFHVVPDSGFPTDNLRIGACDSFGLRFSNKYDMSPENLTKVQVVAVDTKGTMDTADDEVITAPGCAQDNVPVAGGPNCVATDDERDPDGDGEPDPCIPPCLTVNVADQGTGGVSVGVDPAEFGPVLDVEQTYRVLVPGLGKRSDMSNADAYRAAFWDACGMPLVLGGADSPDYLYQFTIDVPKCKEDEDQDTVQLSCDNAPDYFNPHQEDLDGDGIGDVVDLCPTVPGPASNSADSDKDGVGNECDSCRQTLNQYNDVEGVSIDPEFLVRNIPLQTDTDEDGIGDACDNCVVLANCEDYGLASFGAPTDNPYEVGDPILYDDPNKCQRDDDSDLVGDACDGMMLVDTAGGPVGLGGQDDFDQDGLINMIDACPRQPVDAIPCTDDGVCGPGRICESAAGICNHLDSDGDAVGDVCDTCPFAANGEQITDGGMQDDDDDGDFVGKVCETNADCAIRQDARPFSFYEVAANGNCCTVQLLEDPMTGDLVNAITGLPLEDPDGLPVRRNCDEGPDPAARMCRKLPDAVAQMPGVLTPAPGCEAALADAGITAAENPRLTLTDVGSVDALWNRICFLPQFDQDYDGYGDPCDLCAFDFDPENSVYIDANGRVWPTDGKYCNGDYSIENKCKAEDTGGSSGGSDSGSGGSSGTGDASTGG